MDTAKALAIINQHAGKSLVFASREEVENVSPQYEPVVSMLELSKDDFTDVGLGNMYPGKSATNKIADAAGISFIPGIGGTREEGSWSAVRLFRQPVGDKGFWQAQGVFKVIGVAQGQRLKPDGTPRYSSPREYEFNPVDRANEDFLKDYQENKGKYISEISALKHLQELKKFATQRASTGAQLAVIRELAGVPTGFKSNQLFTVEGKVKPMVFSQTIENSRFKMDIAKEIMKTPDGRQSIAQAMFGSSRALYGPQGQPQQVQAPPSETIREAETFDEPGTTSAGSAPEDFGAAGDAKPDPTFDTRLAEVIGALSDWCAAMALPEEVEKAIQQTIDAGETNLRVLEPLLALVSLLGNRQLSAQGEVTVAKTIADGKYDCIVLDAMLVKAKRNAEVFKEAKEAAATKATAQAGQTQGAT